MLTDALAYEVGYAYGSVYLDALVLAPGESVESHITKAELRDWLYDEHLAWEGEEPPLPFAEILVALNTTNLIYVNQWLASVLNHARAEVTEEEG